MKKTIISILLIQAVLLQGFCTEKKSDDGAAAALLLIALSTPPKQTQQAPALACQLSASGAITGTFLCMEYPSGKSVSASKTHCDDAATTFATSLTTTLGAQVDVIVQQGTGGYVCSDSNKILTCIFPESIVGKFYDTGYTVDQAKEICTTNNGTFQ